MEKNKGLAPRFCTGFAHIMSLTAQNHHNNNNISEQEGAGLNKGNIGKGK